ncbi:hypothetical protein KSF78_0009057 [Schistosoma japonicum]|nr:hypothetical protein KSF78_0009057 [Schistosoma japonicum]
MRTNLFFYETTDHCSSSSSSLRYNKLIMIMSCIIVLFLMNILADISAIPYFIHETIIFDEPANTTAEQFIFQNNSLYIKPMKFQVEVHGNSSFGAFFHNLQYCLPFSQTTIGEMMSGKPIHRIVLDSSLLVGYPMIKIIPVPKCITMCYC